VTPPKKQNGQARGRRRIDGKLILGIQEAGELLGLTEKATRARIERGEIPARRLGGRIVVLRAELEASVAALPRVVSVGQETK
jgi:excisionase family DNA binding protein